VSIILTVSALTILTHPASGPTHPLIRYLVRHGQDVKRLFVFTRPASSRFSRELPLEIGVNGTSDISGRALTDVPHHFVDGVAVNDDASTYSNSLSTPGNLLYLLSPPLARVGEISSVQLTVYTSTARAAAPAQESTHKYCDNFPTTDRSSLRGTIVLCSDSCMWVETAIVRHNTADGSLSVAKERFFLQYGDNIHSLRLDGEHPMLRRLRDNDMIGLWIRVAHGRPLVRSAEVVVTSAQDFAIER
jgi:hypothetical protein